jgi:hypothetical protein
MQKWLLIRRGKDPWACICFNGEHGHSFKTKERAEQDMRILNTSYPEYTYVVEPWDSINKARMAGYKLAK